MQLSSRHVLSSLALGTALATAPALAEMTVSPNLNGMPGLIDMPSGDAQPDATFSFSVGNIGPITRTTLSFQATERLSASFRFQTWRDWDAVMPGDAEVREVFRVPKAGMVAGCQVLNGAIKRGSLVRFLREGTIIWTGEISSLRRFKEDVREVASGFECGIGLSDFQDLKNGDIIETYELREIPRT